MSPPPPTHRLLSFWLFGSAAALAAVTLVSLFIGLVPGQVNLANSSMLYLLVVMGSAVLFGRGPAIFAALSAFVIFDWFFVTPQHQLQVTDPGQWVSLLLFLFTATVTGQLAAAQRARAREAYQREREAVVLYDVVRMLGEGSSEEVLQAVADLLRREWLANGGDVGASRDRLESAAAAQIGQARERARLREEATEAEVLQRTDALRAALLNAASQDLRTPLTTIMSSARSLQQDDVAMADDRQQHSAQVIEEEAARLNHLVGNLLELSRIEGGSLHPHKSWQELDIVIDDVVDRLKPVTCRHELHIEVPHDLPPLWFDPAEIGVVISNLVENAAKYAPPETCIDIVVRRTPSHVSVAVEDRGPGIPSGAASQLFEPLHPARDAAPQRSGLGLGLAIVKGLVEAHGGRAWAENRTDGGARFTFTLPLTEVPADVARVGNSAL